MEGIGQVKSKWMCPNGHHFEIDTTVGRNFDSIGNEYILTCPHCLKQAKNTLT